MSRATTQAWAKAVAASRSPSPRIKPRKQQKTEPPARVVIPPRGLDGSTLVVLLDSLKSQIKTKHMQMRCELIVTDKEIRVEWGERNV